MFVTKKFLEIIKTFSGFCDIFHSFLSSIDMQSCQDFSQSSSKILKGTVSDIQAVVFKESVRHIWGVQM